MEVVRLFFDLAQIGLKKALDKWRLSLYIVDMIRSFRHAGLKRFYERGDRRRLLAEHMPKIARVLAQLDIAADASDMDLPGFHLHRSAPVDGQPGRILERSRSRQLADYFPL
jgi:hypothetical protein